MSFNLTGGNPLAHRIRVYFEGGATVLEGMPVCYNYDTTDNWHGGSMTLGVVTETGTTAEGAQNEGKYIRVELPGDGNLIHFAGVVAKGSPGVGKAGPAAIDIYVPNGAIVPVLCDVDTTTGVTILCIQEGEEELGFSNGISTSRPVAIAMETEDGLGGTADITLAKLDPNLFLYQTLDGTAMSIGSGTAYGAINITTSTAAFNQGPQINYTNTGTGAGGMIGFRITCTEAGTALAGNVYALWAQAEFSTSGASTAGEIAGVWSKAYVPADAGTITGAVSGIKISLGLVKAIAGDTCMMHFDVTGGAIKTDYWFIADTSTGEGHSCGFVDDTTVGADDKLGCMKVKVGGTDMYINLYSDSSS